MHWIANILVGIGAAVASLFGSAQHLAGTTVTTILGSDTLSNSRTTINTNFTNLLNGKIESSTTTLPLVTTLANLSTVGTISSGVWQGTAVGAQYGGTGSSTLSQYQVLLGNGTSALTVPAGWGTAGMSLVSNGPGAKPSWQSVGVDQNANYTWNGQNTFTSTTTFTGTALGAFPAFGDGSDGASTTAASYALDRDYYFTNYTVANGNTIQSNGYRIFVTGTLTVNGSVTANGGTGGNGTTGTDQSGTGNATGVSGGTAGAAAYVGGNLPNPFAGSSGGTGTAGANVDTPSGGVSTAINSTMAFIATNGAVGGNGGKGGESICGGGVGVNTGGGAGGPGIATQVEKPSNYFRTLEPIVASTSVAVVLRLAAQSSGGGGGGGACSNNTPVANAAGGGGGGAGGNGGYIFIAAKTITVSATGSITVNGGTGGNGGRGGNASGSTQNVGGGGGGGGAGGNGGLIVLIYSNAYTNSGTITANGGSGGTGGAAGTGATANGVAGNNGNNGNAGQVKLMQL